MQKQFTDIAFDQIKITSLMAFLLDIDVPVMYSIHNT